MAQTKSKTSNAAPFKRGDLVQYYAGRPGSKDFLDYAVQHETSIGIIEHCSDAGVCDIAWVSHNFSQKDVGNNLRGGWDATVLKKIGHVDIDAGEVMNDASTST